MERFKQLRTNLKTTLKWDTEKLHKDAVRTLNKEFGTKRIVWNDKDDLLLASDKFRRRMTSLAVLISTAQRKKDNAKELECRRKFGMMNALAKLKEDDVLTEAQSIYTEAYGEMNEDELDEYLILLETKDEHDVYDIESLRHPFLKANPYVHFYFKVLHPKYKRNIIF
jgi:hypothetical protein